jgi:hypothetical protein
VVSLVTELPGHERQGAEERKPLDASPAAIILALPLTDEELDSLDAARGA